MAWSRIAIPRAHMRMLAIGTADAGSTLNDLDHGDGAVTLRERHSALNTGASRDESGDDVCRLVTRSATTLDSPVDGGIHRMLEQVAVITTSERDVRQEELHARELMIFDGRVKCVDDLALGGARSGRVEHRRNRGGVAIECGAL